MKKVIFLDVGLFIERQKSFNEKLLLNEKNFCELADY